MKLSPNFGLPIAEPDDARRDFPTQVDDPRTMAIDSALATFAAARVRYFTARALAEQNVIAGFNGEYSASTFRTPTFPVKTGELVSVSFSAYTATTGGGMSLWVGLHDGTAIKQRVPLLDAAPYSEWYVGDGDSTFNGVAAARATFTGTVFAYVHVQKTTAGNRNLGNPSIPSALHVTVTSVPG